jgi:periplasmic protein TonB
MECCIDQAPELQRWYCPQTWLAGLAIVALTVAVNLALFGLMPLLLQRDYPPPAFDQPQPINFIRLQRPESPIKKHLEKPPEPPPPQEQPEPPRPAEAVAPPRQLQLSFVLNPQLPARPDSPALPLLPAELPRLSAIGDLFSADDLDTPLTVIARIPPPYPLGAKRRGTEGWVRVRFIVDDQGRVHQVEVIDSSPAGVFDDTVVRSVSSWRFSPGTVGGIAVTTRAETTVHFKLD